VCSSDLSSSFDAEDIFKLLSDGDVEKTFNIITGQQKTLSQIFKSE
jgi:hypothetical protein